MSETRSAESRRGTAHVRNRGRRLRFRWTTIRRLVQYLALLVFISLFVASRGGGWPDSLVNAPMRLDPLTMMAQGLASRSFLVGSALALIVLALTLVFGRAWCGWICPLGTVLDLFSLRWLRGKRDAPPESWRAIKHGLLVAILGAAAFTNLTLLVLDPLTLLYRTLSAGIWPLLDRMVTAAEVGLYRFPSLRPAVVTFDGLLRPTVLPAEHLTYRVSLLFVVVLLAIVALNVSSERFWCRYLCPLGGLLGLLSKAALVSREVDAECAKCDLCSDSCPTGTIQPQRGYESDPGECTMCLECLEACRKSRVRFPARMHVAKWMEYDPGRRQVLTVLGATIVGIGVIRTGLGARSEKRYLIRPPGAQEEELLAKCVRCGECVRSCPTGAIQPSLSETGLEGLWTPLLIPRLGYCDFACNACGHICPVEAIPPLSLEDKRAQVIGHAFIDEDRCIPWAEHRDCIVCEEMCPVPEKAILLEPFESQDDHGQQMTVQRPRVLREKCIGCGICEYKCPVEGEAAIRIYAPESELRPQQARL